MSETKNSTNGEINEISNVVRKDYYKAWRAKNKEKVRIHNQNFWQKKAAEKLRQEAADKNDAENQ